MSKHTVETMNALECISSSRKTTIWVDKNNTCHVYDGDYSLDSIQNEHLMATTSKIGEFTVYELIAIMGHATNCSIKLKQIDETN